MNNPDITPKSLWRVGNNQHRVVIFVQDKQVFYAGRGGNVLNPFGPGENCSIDTFLKKGRHIGEVKEAEWKQVQNDLAPWIVANKESDKD
jgi:hypothetical protein